ncbi:MFS transporter [Pantoea ananatis BRT175]|uniref:MFS transporter n=1 Tax=Pantoea ananas TaxID=553 RepID=UPI0003B1D0C8|nr:MFS transporter [Pantoea ananatis]ERM15486.1 MFS transporter [Pantoea ananatis BRT175]
MSEINLTAESVNQATAKTRVLCFIALALIAALLNSSAPTPLYPLYQQQLGLTAVSLTVIYGAYAAGVLIALFSVGNLAWKVADLRSLMMHALLAVFAGALLFSLADSFACLFMARLLAGVGTGALTGAANIALVRFGPKDGGKVAALLATLSFTTGLALGPVFSGVAIQTGFHSQTLPFLLIMLTAAIALIGLRFSWPVGRHDQPSVATSSPASSVEATLKAGLKATGVRFFLFAGALFMSWAFAASILSIGPAVSEHLLGIHSQGIYGYVIAVYLVVAGISQILSRRIRARTSLAAGCPTQAISIVLFTWAIGHHSLVWACTGLIVAGYSYGAIFVGSATLVNMISPAASHAKLISLFYVIAYIANWVPVLLGAVVDHASLNLAVNLLFGVGAVVCLLLSIAVFGIKMEKARRNDVT